MSDGREKQGQADRMIISWRREAEAIPKRERPPFSHKYLIDCLTGWLKGVKIASLVCECVCLWLCVMERLADDQPISGFLRIDHFLSKLSLIAVDLSE